MVAPPIQDVAEWQSRMAHAMKAYFAAMDARAPSVEIVMRHERVRALEREGQRRGFLSSESTRVVAGGHGSSSGERAGHIVSSEAGETDARG